MQGPVCFLQWGSAHTCREGQCLAWFFLPELCYLQLGSSPASTPSLGGPSQRSGHQRLLPVCGTRLKGAASSVCKRSQLPPALSWPLSAPGQLQTRPCSLPSGQCWTLLLRHFRSPRQGSLSEGEGNRGLGCAPRGRWVGRMAPPSRICSGTAAAIQLPELLGSTAG